MPEPAHSPPAHAYAPWWRSALVGLSVIAALVITKATGVGVVIVVGAIALLDTAGIVLLTLVRAHRHGESFGAAARAVLVGEYGRWRLEERSNRADLDNRRDADRGGGHGAHLGG